jgi:hypothetical protein
MTGDPSPSPFELAVAELRRLGITLASLPGEYRVNVHNGADATACMVETLDEALELGRSMAAERPAPVRPAGGKRRRRRMTPKAHNKRMRMQHFRRMRAQAKRTKRTGDKGG